MNNPRHVKRLLSVFDLPDCGSSGLPEGTSTRVMYFYDEEAKIKEFRILGKNITVDEDTRIKAWLNENVDHAAPFPDSRGHGPVARFREDPC